MVGNPFFFNLSKGETKMSETTNPNPMEPETCNQRGVPNQWESALATASGDNENPLGLLKKGAGIGTVLKELLEFFLVALFWGLAIAGVILYIANR